MDFQPGLSGTITLTSATLAIAKDLTIMGSANVITGANLITVSGNKLFQVFKIASAANVTISSLTIAGGAAPRGLFGGGIDNEGTLIVTFITLSGNSGGGGGVSGGGGIYNSSTGKVSVSYSTISGNGGFEGGGIYNDGTLTVSNSTLSGNSAGLGLGGGIFNSSSGTLNVSNSLLSGNGNNSSGGGIYNDGMLTVESSMFSGNLAIGAPGGGIFNRGTLTVRYSIFTGNVGEDGGGAIENVRTLTVSACTFSGNGAGSGGAINSEGNAPLSISDSIFVGNSSEFIHAIFAFSKASVTITNCVISDNHGPGSGSLWITGNPATISNCTITGNGGIGRSTILTGGTVTISNCTISGNLAVDSGAIYNVGTLTVSNCTISGNRGVVAGGILNNGTLTVSNSTISGNTAYLGGTQTAGAIVNSPGSSNDATAMLLNSTIANNTANGNSGSQLFSGQVPYSGTGKATIQLHNTIISGDGSRPNFLAGLGGSFVSQGHNLSSDNGNGFLTAHGDLINANPLLGPLQDNGGRTQTMALLPGSPAVDAGDNIGAPVLDQRGLPRTVGGTIDIGAFEVQPGPATHFQVSAPAHVTAGMPFNVMVTALDVYGHTAVGYLGTVTFRSSDPGPGVVLPPNYAFTPADSGVHIFANGVTLRNKGTQTVTATDTVTSSISGSASLFVTLPVSIVATTSVNPSVYGQPVTFTAAVTSGGSPVTTGTITFQEGSTVLAASVPLDSSGHANLQIATLTAPGSPHTITVYYSGTATFDPNSGSVTQTVNKATLFVTADDKTRMYGQANPVFTVRYTGFVLGENQNVLSGMLSLSTPATTNSNAGTYAIAPSGLTSPNYTITFANGTLTVTTAPLTVTANNASKVYGQANPAFSASYSGFVLGQDPSDLGGTLAFSTPATNGSNVGSYPIAPSGLASSNYAITFVNGTLTVAPAPLIVIAANVSRTYGAANPALTGAIAGLQNGDAITARYTTVATPASSVGAYTITASLSDPTNKLSNYNVTVNNGTLTVTPAPLVVTPADASREFGAPNPAFVGAISGIQNNDPITASYNTTATLTSPVGTYPITATLNDPDNKLGNYSVTLNQGTLTITPATASTLVLAGFPSPTTAGTEGTFMVTVQDRYGNTATGYRGTVHFSSSDTLASLPADYTFTAADNGVHGFSAVFVTAGNQSLTVTDTQSGSITDSQSGIAITPAAAGHFLVASSLATTVAGTPFDVTVTVQDAYNNTVTGYTGTVAFSSADPYGATLPADYTFTAADNGTHIFALGAILYTTGTWNLTSTDAARGVSGSANVTVRPASAVQFQLVAPAMAAANTPFDVTVSATDLYGNVDNNYQGIISFYTTDPDPGVVLPADYTFTADDAGVHTFTAGVALVTPGDQTLTVTDTNGFTGSATITVMAPQTPPGGGRGRCAGEKGAVAGIAVDQSTAGTVQSASPSGKDSVASREATPRSDRPLPRHPAFPRIEEVIDQFFAKGFAPSFRK